MTKPALTDRNQFPTDEVISSLLGRRRALWDALFAHLRAEHPECTATWRYYNDGNSWLLNVSRKKKTVFWLSVIRGTFRITGYFTDKAKLRGITVTFKTKKDVEDARRLIALKIGAATPAVRGGRH